MEYIQGTIDCTPEETGYDGTRIAVLHEHFERLIKQKIIHGAAYCISHKGKIIAHGSIGKDNAMGRDTGMQPDTVFCIASITKVFTATAIMQLVERGLVRLDTPVAEILPQFAHGPLDSITLFHLLTHTSGLYPDENCFPESCPKSAWELLETAYEQAEDKEAVDWIAAGTAPGLRVPAGTQWQYCSFGFSLLGEVVTRVSGINVHRYIQNYILKPLKMNDSGFLVTGDMAKRHFCHDKKEEKWLKEIMEGSRKDCSCDEEEARKAGSREWFWSRIPSTGGGLHATVSDLIQFANAMLYGGRLGDARILGRKMVEKMATIQLHNIPDYCWGAKEPDRLYGIGFDMRQGPAYTYSEGTFMHEGAGACSLDIDPAEQFAAAWYVPFACDDWSALPLYNTQNVIWSGL